MSASVHLVCKCDSDRFVGMRSIEVRGGEVVFRDFWQCEKCRRELQAAPEGEAPSPDKEPDQSAP